VIKGKIQTETVYGITSLSKEQADPLTLLDINRGHWGIENKLHYVRDVTFNEDHCRIRKKSGAHVMACFRNIVINLFRLWKIKNIAQALRHFAWNAKDFILQLLGLHKNHRGL
jgi:predicted transposase YbfD/YdcC